MKIYNVTDPEFKKYGTVITHLDFTELAAALADTPVTEGVVYEPSVESLEAVPLMKELSEIYYGEMPIQIGFCNGYNTKLNALEYHRDSEINVGTSDFILLLGSRQDITEDFHYDTAKVEAFLVPAGVAVEVYATTLHYAPCRADGLPFQVAVVLPKDTNLPLLSSHQKDGDGAVTEDRLLAARNKWLIGHKDGGLDESAWIGMIGENLEI
ncbi:MAG: DUF4867 family protein [Lachnospiraceae bacterium]|nr:DUF4867 family protein [Lachnospiraceae bacterium]